MIEDTCEIYVRYAETDQMQFAHHSNYVVWFEHGRIQLLKKYDFSYAELEEKGYLMPVLELHINFFKYACFDDKLLLKTVMPAAPTAKQKFRYEIHNENNEIICTGSSLHTFMSKENKAIKPPRELITKFKTYFNS